MISDNFSNANQNDVKQFLRLRYTDFERVKSTTTIVLTGMKTGYQLHLAGKLANSGLRVNATNATGVYHSQSDTPPTGCILVFPGITGGIISGGTAPNLWVDFGITSSTDVTAECKGVTNDVDFDTFPPTPLLLH